MCRPLAIGVSGVPQNIDMVVSGLRMDEYNQIIDRLKQVVR